MKLVDYTSLAILTAALILAATLSHAAQCGPTPQVREVLEEQYGELLIWQGINANGQAITELWLSDDTFTVVVTAPDGTSCIGAAGREWMDLPRAWPGELG